MVPTPRELFPQCDFNLNCLNRVFVSVMIKINFTPATLEVLLVNSGNDGFLGEGLIYAHSDGFLVNLVNW